MAPTQASLPMKFTHREIEEDRRKPVGSLFMHLVDRDSMPSRRHRNTAARQLNAHSLPNTQLSLYAHDTATRAETPLRGRCHFPKSSRHVNCEQAEWVRPTSGVSRTATPHGGVDHIGTNMTPRPSAAEASPPRQRRHVAPPAHSSPSRPFWLGDDPIVQSAQQRRAAAGAGSSRSSSVGAAPYSRRSSGAGHLTIGSLLPLPEKAVEKPVPAPLPVRPRTTGLRLFPERRSRSVDELHRGIRMVSPQPHWRSAADRQWDFLELGIAHRETAAPLYRNESHVDIGGPIVRVAGQSAAQTPQQQRWRGGRRYSVTPNARGYDIITGRALVY